MAILLILFFLFLLGKSPRDRRNSDMGKRIILGFAIFCVVIPLLAELLPLLGGLAFMVGFGAMIWYMIRLIREKSASDRRTEQYGWDPKRWSEESSYGQQTSYSRQGSYNRQSTGNQQNPYGRQNSNTQQTAAQTSLPRSVKKRRRILENFNEKYDLDLTPEQMSSIVNSSYMSEVWRRELEAMDQKYETVYEWFQGTTGWLRAYMYVFHIQEITSDIRQQEEICMYSFETIFQYVDSLGNIPQSRKIEMVNNKYFTSFDDVSFMMAYRFLEAKGLNHDLKSPHLAKNTDSAEDLVNRYAPQEDKKLGL